MRVCLTFFISSLPLFFSKKKISKMKLYLSSYKFGNETEQLKSMMPQNNRIGHIINARDKVNINPEALKRIENEELGILRELGFDAEPLNLQHYFNKETALKERLQELGGVWISGGNTFVLRQAMKLSSFDRHLNELKKNPDFLYAGYSAAACILSKSLKPIDQVDKPFYYPYKEIQETIWEGLGLLDYIILPHYKSDHPESEMIGKEVERCIANNWAYKTLRDGEVLIITAL